MATYHLLGQLMVLIALIVNSSYFCIQIWAVLKYRQRCFALLATGAALGMIYSVTAGLPFFVKVDLASHVLFAEIGLALVVVAATLSVWGMLLLVRSYRMQV